MLARKASPRFGLIAVILLFAVAVLPLSRVHSAEAQCPSAVPKMLDDWGDVHNRMVADAKARGGEIKIVFAGDSIATCWTSGAGRKIWDQRYAPQGAINLSIPSDATQHLLWRLQHDVLEPLHPKMVILLIGANNLSQDPKAAAYGVWSVVSYLRKTLPDTRVLVQGIFRRENPPAMIPKATLVNAYLAKLDDGKMVKFLDFSSKFLKPDGTLNRANFPDGCHPETPEAFQIWGDSIQPVIDEWLKAPPIANVPPPPSPVDEPADKSGAIPESRNDFLYRHNRFVEQAAKGNCDLLFLGDTTMACWNRVEALTRKEYGPMHWENFANWGSRTENILWQLNNGELEGIRPKLVVVQVQENLYGKTPAQDVAAGMEAIARLIHQKLPQTKVLLLGAFENPLALTHEKIAEYDSLLAKLADGKSVYFFDIGKAFVETAGTSGAASIPGPNPWVPTAFDHWADAQRTTIAELMAISSAPAMDTVKLEPNAMLSFEFPDLPETYFAHFHKDGQKHPAKLTAQLPENYSPNGKFPLFLFLSGGNGGPGDNAAFVRRIIGSRDYIAVNVPLFKDTNHPAPAFLDSIPKPKGVGSSYIVNMNDFPVISPSFRVMLQKLLEAVPNTTPQGSAIGGFSNGANTTSVLLAGKDEFILSHFTSYIFLEGGIALITNPETMQDPVMKKFRFLSLSGDDPNNPPGRQTSAPLIQALREKVKALNLDSTYVVMAGYGHATPPEYLKLIGNWVRGEPLPKIAPATKSSGPVPDMNVR